MVDSHICTDFKQNLPLFYHKTAAMAYMKSRKMLNAMELTEHLNLEASGF